MHMVALRIEEHLMILMGIEVLEESSVAYLQDMV